ncbi:hypothetical protein L1D54_07545, partial [Vibrio brasiliensis]|uniref:hypothetical protein n=1 Tax=Vibrio brasiliensis TaxID=170652 RepID=UPI001EFE0BDA
LFWIIFNVNVLDKLKTAKSCFFMVFLAILLVVIFKETTEMKAYKSEMFDWAIHLNTTISTQVVSINSWVTDIHGFDYLKAYVFLSHYLYHSIGELSGYLLSDKVNFFNITAQISKNATCSVLKCLPDEDYYRVGAYKTMYFDFINDFGLIFGVILLALLLAIFMLSCFKLSRLSLNTFVILVVICLSPILNFVYGGMGLFQLMCIPIITMGSFFVTRRNFGS